MTARTGDVNFAFARSLVDEWARSGVEHAVVAPGSRSTPLVLALVDEPRVTVHVLLDERSAAFFALGLGRATGRPAVVVCTSGTAAVNLHPAVVEAHHGRVPLLVCTADRPPELRDVGAPQTIDQVKLFGAAVRWAHEPAPPDDGSVTRASWRPLGPRTIAEALGPPAGPVHLNLPFREPLVPSGRAVDVPPGRPDGRPWAAAPPDDVGPPVPGEVDRLAALADAHERGVVVAGWSAGCEAAAALAFSRATGWPVLADPLSGLRVPGTVSTFDALLRSDRFAADHRPDVVVRLGAPPTSKVTTAWLSEAARQVLVDPDRAWLDPTWGVTERLVSDPAALLGATSQVLEPRGASAWAEAWQRAEGVARTTVDGVLDGWEVPFEGRVARDVVAGLPAGATLAVGSSMPVRDVDSFAAPREGVRFVANRGASGIDGFVSTVLGVAEARREGAVVALCGDLTFLHDGGGLLAAGFGAGAVFVVIDNGGGGIFSFLPQASLPPPAGTGHFERLFAAGQEVDLAALARVHGFRTRIVEHAGAVAPAVSDAVAEGGAQLVRVPTDRDDNVKRHRMVWDEVRRALG